nr:DMT family transporter [Micromonospora sp. DSM 115978]
MSPPPPATAIALAVALSIVSALAYALAAVLQERVAARFRPGSTGSPGPARFPFLAVLRWWISVGLNGAGGALHVAALAFGPLSVVQPLGVLTLVLALPLGALAGGRWASARQWRGAVATVAGLALLLALTVSGADRHGLDRDQAGVVSTVATVLVVGLALLARRYRSATVRGLLAAVAAGIAFAVASALTQPVLGILTTDGTAILLSPLPVVLAGMAVAGILLSQSAYRDSGLGAPLAAVTLTNPVASIVIAVLLLGDRATGGAWGTLAALTGAGVAAAGVLMLCEPEPVTAAAEARPRSGRPDNLAR